MFSRTIANNSSPSYHTHDYQFRTLRAFARTSVRWHIIGFRAHFALHAEHYYYFRLRAPEIRIAPSPLPWALSQRHDDRYYTLGMKGDSNTLSTCECVVRTLRIWWTRTARGWQYLSTQTESGARQLANILRRACDRGEGDECACDNVATQLLQFSAIHLGES